MIVRSTRGFSTLGFSTPLKLWTLWSAHVSNDNLDLTLRASPLSSFLQLNTFWIGSPGRLAPFLHIMHYAILYQLALIGYNLRFVAAIDNQYLACQRCSKIVLCRGYLFLPGKRASGISGTSLSTHSISTKVQEYK